MKLVWTRHATERRREIFLHIAEDNVEAALALDTLFEASASQILHFPQSGRRGRVPGTRELVIRVKYILVYRIVEDTLQVLTIYHAAQDYPPNRQA